MLFPISQITATAEEMKYIQSKFYLGIYLFFITMCYILLTWHQIMELVIRDPKYDLRQQKLSLSDTLTQIIFTVTSHV